MAGLNTTAGLNAMAGLNVMAAKAPGTPRTPKHLEHRTLGPIMEQTARTNGTAGLNAMTGTNRTTRTDRTV
ncbi:7980_t:CDS:2, partial [Cetraspora pellucida]